MTRRRLGHLHALRLSRPSFSSLLPRRRQFTDHRVAATYQWFESVVVGQKLCPFAPPYQQSPDLMRVVVCAHPTYAAASTSTTPIDDDDDIVNGMDCWRRKSIEFVQTEIQALVGHAVQEPATAPLDATTAATTNSNIYTVTPPKHETTLVILDHPKWSQDFQAFVRFSWDLQEQAIVQANLVGTLQLVLFHPLATHQTYGMTIDKDAEANPGDYTIRSPYPTVHLLREVDVLRAVQGAYPNLESLPARNQAKFVQQGVQACQRRLADCYTIKSK